MSAIYKKIWQQKIPAKIKITAWKFLKNCSPITSILYSRRIASSSICPRCHQCSETPLHVLLWCGPTQTIWVNLGFSWPIDITWEDFWNWLGNHTMKDNRLTCWRFFITGWCLWYTRNQYVMEGKTHTVRDICVKVESTIKELKEVDVSLLIQNSNGSP